MKIGTALQTLERSEKEGHRILNAVIEKEGKPFEIYSSFSVRCDNAKLWSKAQKVLNITGFRPGKAKSIILPRIYQQIKIGNTHAISIFWMLYKQCIVDYLNKESPNLNQLLLQREYEGDPESSKSLLKAIKDSSELYEVSNSQIEDLYEGFWFERVEDLANILSSTRINLSLVKELIHRSERSYSLNIESLRKEITDLKSRYELTANVEELTRKISSINSRVDILQKDFDLEAAKFEKH